MPEIDHDQEVQRTGLEIAVVSMAGRFPGANSLAQFWENVANGVDSIARFTDDELLEQGIDPSILQKANYVKAKGFVEDIEYFDAAFFHYSEREAEIMDPQIRILQECVWEALEHAGYVPQTYKGRISLFAGASTNYKWIEQTPLGQGAQGAEFVEAATLSYKDSLSTLTAYKLDLKGPSLSLYTACSTSLLSIHLACRALLTGECELALAGGVSISYPKKHGYLYEVGMTASPDGRVRPFDANAEGAVFGDGVGIVLLKRLEEALQDGDVILAVIKGSAANNDGARKVGYTAPSVEGQTEVIAAAQSLAEVEPESISYVETHGTATPLGDTIEFEALKRAFATTKRSYCAIGSVKSNVGHLDTAAGVTGLIKTVLALQHRQIPPSLHFEHPNPKIDFVDSPFYVSTELAEWQADTPRRAGVSAFGYGGTNVHIILEEAAQSKPLPTKRPQQLLTLSARTPSALERMTRNLLHYLQSNADISLVDVAYTLQVGRRAFQQRRALPCSSVEEAISVLSKSLSGMPQASPMNGEKDPELLLYFGSGGVKRTGALGELYRSEPLVRDEIERCFDLIETISGTSLDRAAMLTTTEPHSRSPQIEPLRSFSRDFTLEYALARSLILLGLHPSAMIVSGLSHDIAACLAGVLTLEDAVRWGVARVQLMTEPANRLLRERLKRVMDQTHLNKPTLPIISLATGLLITDDEAQDPQFWLGLIDRFNVMEPLDVQFWLGWQNAVVLQIGEGHEEQEAWKQPSTLIKLCGQDDASNVSDTSFLDVLAALWIRGKTIDWEKLYAGEKRSRLPLPTYPFEKQRFWIEPPNYAAQKQDHQVEKRATIAEWFYTPSWQEKTTKTGAVPLSTWLLLLDHGRIGEQLALRLNALGHRVVTVCDGAEFTRLDENKFAIRASQADDYHRLLEEIDHPSSQPLRMVHLWTLEASPLSSDQHLDLGLYSLLHLTKAIALQNVGLQIEISVLTNHLYKVTQADRVVAEKATLLAPLKVIPQEHPNVRCRSIDCDLADLTQENALDALVQEVVQGITDTEIAYRQARRYVRTFEPLPAERLTALAIPTDKAVPMLREGGAYAITGGLGGIGLKLADYLARSVHAKLVLISRAGLPPKETWPAWLETHHEDDLISFRIRRVQALEASGAEVLVLAANVANEEQMRHAFHQAETAFGDINGVIHAAGILRVASALCPIVKIGRAECEEQFQPKMQGLQVLHKILEKRQLDFCLVVSSLSPILGGLGFVAYAAANLYMDGFIAQQSKPSSQRWIGVNWGDWQYTGPKIQKRIARAAIDELEMTTQEAIKTFQCILSLENVEQVVISSGDLAKRMKQWVQLKPLRPDGALAQVSGLQREPSVSIKAQEQFEQMIVDLWLNFYRVQTVDRQKNFFELGATSLDMIQIHTKLVNVLQRHISIEIIFENPTIAQLAAALSQQAKPESSVAARRKPTGRRTSVSEIAVIGLAGRFPGADSVDEFWENLVNGVESIRFFSDKEMIDSGVRQDELRNPNYRRAKGYLEGTEYFDAPFFDYTPRDALLMDPQLRIFHECSWSALENAGYTINHTKRNVGVFAGASPNLYWQVLSMLAENEEPAGLFLTSLLNDKDSLSTQISYKFDLNGPSVNVFSGCSTSMVAIDAACNALLAGQCEMAIAGGITVTQPDKAGYLYQEGMLFSADGHCRTFDAKASGMVFGDGVGVVILKPLDTALADGDTIHAIIKGSATNNDGHRKVGYTAPSVDGQAEVIVEALAKAGVEPESIGYIETHGTATQLGDVIEVAALKKAFGTSRQKRYPLGSVKTNVGHLNAASGVAGFIKTVLCLEHKMLPPSLHFETQNPQIDFANGQFYVNTEVQEWRESRSPLRAGVSSFGIGGTNAHVILEEGPVREPSSEGREWKMLFLSAKSPAALERMTDNLVEHCQKHPEVNLADAAYTLQVGRQAFDSRRTLVCRTTQEALDQLTTRSAQVRTFQAPATKRSVVLMFPGNAAQYVHMGQELYEKEALFRAEMETCFAIVRSACGIEIKPVLYPDDGEDEAQAKLLMKKMVYSQPIIFCLEYALAKLLISWGIQPAAMIGYSFGEYVAACLAGVFSLRDALLLVTARGRLMSQLPEGAMLSVPLPEKQTLELLDEFKALQGNDAVADASSVTLAIDNGLSCIVAGSPQTIAACERFLRSKRLLSMRVASDVAAHSSHLDEIVRQFAEQLQQVTYHRPSVPFISGITGTWITDEQAQDPHYWARHMQETMRFARGIEELIKDKTNFLIEVGPGRDLSVLLSRFFEGQELRVQSTMRPEAQSGSDLQVLFEGLATLWALGLPLDWAAFYAQEQRRRIPLPTYAFERISYKRQGNPFEFGQKVAEQTKRAEAFQKDPDRSKWFYLPRWRSDSLPAPQACEPRLQWLILADTYGVALKLIQDLRDNGQDVVTVEAGESFACVGEDAYQLNWGEREHYQSLIAELHRRNRLPSKIVHCASLSSRFEPEDDLAPILGRGFYSVLFLMQALSKQTVIETLDLRIITNGTQHILGDEKLVPAQACLIGPSLVVAQELPYVTCSVIDIVMPERGGLFAKKLLKQLKAECLAETDEHLVAYRGEHRWVRDYQPFRLERAASKALPLRQGGVYLITGAFGGIGRILARHLAQTYQAKLVLVSRSALPERDDWQNCRAEQAEQEALREKRGFVQELEALGAEVLVFRADVVDRQRMASVLCEAERRFGAVNGVIHAAGLLGDETFKILRELDISECEKQFQAKVHGVLVLEQLLREKELDFCLLMSSIACVLGGLGYSAYTAANLFMDAFVQQQACQSSLPWRAVNWSDWKYWDESEQQGSIGQSVYKLSMEPEEGIDAFERTLASEERLIVHSPGNLDLRIEQWVKLQPVHQQENDHVELQLHPRPELRSAYVAPRNQIEQTLAEIWTTVFRVEKVGINDDFFELRGDSLKGVSVVSRIHRELSVEVPISELFLKPTIAELATYVQQARGRELAIIPVAPVKALYRLSSAQRRLYILHQLHPDSTAYNDVMAYVLDGPLDSVRFEAIFHQLIERHESFRTSFAFHDGELGQMIHAAVDFRLVYQETTEEMARDLVKHFIVPFDLSQAPLIRVGLLKIGVTRHILVLDMHHSITDGVSYDCLVRDFITLYRGETLAPLRLQYKDYAEWEASEEVKALVAKQETYWLKRFADHIPTLNLITDYARPAIQDFAGDSIEFSLGREVTEQIKNAALSRGATVYMYLLSVFNILLFKYTGQSDIIVGSPTAGRSHPDLQGIIGMFVNMLPIRTCPSGEKVFLDYLRMVQEAALEAFEHDQYQYEELIVKLGLHGNVDKNPLFNVVFVLQNMDTGPLNVGDFQVAKYDFTPNRAQFDLLLSAVEIEGSFVMTMEYATALYRRETIAKMVARYRAILQEVLEHPEIMLKDIIMSHDLRVLDDDIRHIASEDFAF